MDESLLDNIENGEICEDSDGNKTDDYTKEIYQYYLIDKGGADYLKRNTDEIVMYSDKLDLWVWGITHFGTSWSGVYTTLQDKEN